MSIRYRFAIACLRALALLPLPLLRAVGWLLGWLLYAMAARRRHIVHVNLGLCFPKQTPGERRALAAQVFIRFAQAWLDRAWLWHGSAEVVRRRTRIAGPIEELQGDTPTVLLMPHFVGLDAGWMALTQEIDRQFTTIYARQSSPALDAWILAGRQRFGRLRPFGRHDGAKTIVAALRRGEPLCLLPDMDLGRRESVFVPFYGISTATVPSLSRFASLGRAKVVPVFTRMTPWGYEVQVMPAWKNFPSDDATADTAFMNAQLQLYIDTMPDQYYWVHKRFKTRPAGQASFY